MMELTTQLNDQYKIHEIEVDELHEANANEVKELKIFFE